MAEQGAARKATIVVFSGNYDKVMGAFIIATTAQAMGLQTTMFFTFWGLSALKTGKKSGACKRNWMQAMMGMMLPKRAANLTLSQLNMAGMGPTMLKSIMKGKGFASLPELIETAKDLEVRMIACQMSMDAMGICKEELMDGVEIAGAATYVGEAKDGGLSLFIG
jgi:peroxiredoxin family protein